MNVLYFGTYDPSYARNRVILKGLQSSGVRVRECRSNTWGPLKYLVLAVKGFFAAHGCDAVIVGFPGQESTIVASLVMKKPLLFDGFASHYEGYVLDRKKSNPGSMSAWWYHFIDRLACHQADAVLTDTVAHADFFTRMFGISRTKLHPIPVGTDTDIFRPMPESTDQFTVHFHGHYIPLQGVRYILEAAAILRSENIRFSLIGRGQTYDADRAWARSVGLENVTFTDHVAYNELASRMGAAQVCLGIFGDTPKTATVIPNKVYEALAVGRAVITADTLAIRELLDDSAAVLVPSADPQALANAILRLRNDASLRQHIATAGHRRFMEKATPDIIGRSVRGILNDLVS